MRILIILLFLSFNSFSQTYKDIMSIDSEDAFIKVCIENGYTKQRVEEGFAINILSTPVTSFYGLNYNARDNYDALGAYQDSIGRFFFNFHFERKSTDNMPFQLSTYNRITSEIKKNCEYSEVFKPEGTDYVLYDCDDAKYKGRVAFSLQTKKVGMQGIITNVFKN